MRKLLVLLLILILAIFVFTGCKGLVPSDPEPTEGDVTTINGQIKMPGACCDPLGEEKQGMSRAESTYDETKSWAIIPGAVVELKNASNCKIVDKTESDEAGYYEFEDVQPGLYIITAYCPSNVKYLLKDVAKKVSGQALDAGIPDCDSTSLALVIEFLEDCYDGSYLCFGKYNQVYRMVEKIAEDVGEVDIPAILDHDDFGVLGDDDEDDLVDLVCDKLMGCCVSSGPGGGSSTPAPTPTPTPIPEYEYILTVNIEGNGSVIKDPLGPTYASGTTVTLNAEPDIGWTFTEWSGDLTGTNTSEDITMDENKTVTATFVLEEPIPEDEYILTINIVGNGSVTKTPDFISYDSGEVVTLDPEADTGWIFTGWSGDLTGSNDPENITMDEDKTVIATFVLEDIEDINDGPEPIDLGSSANFVILTKAGITNTDSHLSDITGDIGSSPISATAMDGVWCSEISGTIYGVDPAYTGSGTTTCFEGGGAAKTLVDNAVLDIGIAYTDAAGRTEPAPVVELGAGNIGGLTLAPGLYKWNTSVNIATDVTLSGGANDVWIFQIEGDLTIASNIKVLLAGGAQASNIFWQVAGGTGATLGTYSTFEGTILSATQIVLQTGAVLNGRALAQTQVTLDQSTVTMP